MHMRTLQGRLTLLYICAAPCSENVRSRLMMSSVMRDKISGDCSRLLQVALSAGPIWTQTHYLRKPRFNGISLQSKQHLNECEPTLSMSLISNCKIVQDPFQLYEKYPNPNFCG